MHFLDETRVWRWLNPDRCTCEKAVEHWARVDAEEAKKREEEERRAQEEARIKKARELFRQSQLPVRFAQRTFENFTPTEHNQGALQTAKSYAENFEQMRKMGYGLNFTGPVGTGKTHLAAAIAMHLMANCYSVIFGTVTTLLGRIRQTYDEDSRITERQIIDQLANVSLLVIDDLGKEKPTPWVEQTLYEIINLRYENNKPLVITTNVKLKDIRDLYERNGPAIESRLLEMCHGVVLSGPDYRKKNLF